MADDVRHREFMTIAKVVAEHYGVSVEKMRGESRLKFFYVPRAVTMLLIREKYAASYPEIGRFFDRDHTTVIIAVRAIETEVSQTDFAQIRAKLENKPTEGCHRCNTLMLELASLKVEILEMRARFNGCG